VVKGDIGCKYNGNVCPKCGKIHPDYTGKNNSMNLPEAKKNHLLKLNSKEYKKKQREKKLGKNNPNYKHGKLCGLWNGGYIKKGWNPKSIGKRITREFIIQKNKNPDFIKKRMKALNIKPNKKEIILNNLLQNTFPFEWKYVGNGKIIIDRLNPDFINCNGKKLIIELFGDYWHSAKIAHITEEERRKRFAKYGFKMLVIWESELKNLNKVSSKIKDFTRINCFSQK